MKKRRGSWASSSFHVLVNEDLGLHERNSPVAVGDSAGSEVTSRAYRRQLDRSERLKYANWVRGHLVGR